MDIGSWQPRFARTMKSVQWNDISELHIHTESHVKDFATIFHSLVSNNIPFDFRIQMKVFSGSHSRRSKMPCCLIQFNTICPDNINILSILISVPAAEMYIRGAQSFYPDCHSTCALFVPTSMLISSVDAIRSKPNYDYRVCSLCTRYSL